MMTYRTEYRLYGVKFMAQATLAERTIDPDTAEASLRRLKHDASLSDIVEQDLLRRKLAHRMAVKHR